MHVRRMIATAGYAPEKVATLSQAFDDAWDELAADIRAGPDAERLRFKLAGIIMLTGRRVTDPIELRRIAVRIIAHSEGWDDGPYDAVDAAQSQKAEAPLAGS